MTATVDDLSLNGNCTQRQAIRAASLDQPVDACPAGNGADTILLSPGAYVLSIPGDEHTKDLMLSLMDPNGREEPQSLCTETVRGSGRVVVGDVGGVFVADASLGRPRQR